MTARVLQRYGEAALVGRAREAADTWEARLENAWDGLDWDDLNWESQVKSLNWEREMDARHPETREPFECPESSCASDGF